MTNAKKTLQQKMSELDTLVEWFQGDEFELEKAKENLKKAAELAHEIEKDLATFTNEINEVKRSFQTESEA